MIDVVAEIMRRSTAEWMSMLEEAGIPAGPINTVAQALNDPHVLAREMVTLDHPTAGEISVTGNPAKFSATSEKHRRRHRCLEHTDEILRSLGYTESRIAELRTGTFEKKTHAPHFRRDGVGNAEGGDRRELW